VEKPGNTFAGSKVCYTDLKLRQHFHGDPVNGKVLG